MLLQWLVLVEPAELLPEEGGTPFHSVERYTARGTTISFSRKKLKIQEMIHTEHCLLKGQRMLFLTYSKWPLTELAPLKLRISFVQVTTQNPNVL